MTQLSGRIRPNFPTLAAIGMLGVTPLFFGCGEAPGGGVNARAAVTVVPSDEAELRDRIDRIREVNSRRRMNIRDHAAWQIVHGILAYQDQLKIATGDGPDAPHEVAVDWIFKRGLRGFSLQPGKVGQRDVLATVLEGGSKTGQGHPDQWIGYLLCDYRPGRPHFVGRDTVITYRNPADGKEQKYTLAQMIEAAQHSLQSGQECGWTLLALTAFPDLVPLDQEWTVELRNNAGEITSSEKWSIERILREEVRQPLHSAACGGTHRLIGLSVSLQRYRDVLERHGKPANFEGGWREADLLVGNAIQTLREFQQPDGAFSAQWLQIPRSTNDATVRIRTSGHALEFLAITLSPEQLRDPRNAWVTKAVVHLCDLFDELQEMPVECGALYHALHGLQVYREKRWGPRPAPDKA